MSGFAEYDDYDGLGLGQLVREGHISASELLEEAITRTERVNGELNALVYPLYDEARSTIKAGLPQGPFCGVPFLLKDFHLFIKGAMRSNGSAMWRGMDRRRPQPCLP